MKGILNTKKKNFEIVKINGKYVVNILKTES